VRRELGSREICAAENAAVERLSQKRQDTITYTTELRKGDSFDMHFSRQKLAVYEDLLRATGSHLKTAEWLGLDPKALHHRIRRLKQQIKPRSRPNSD
jgi:hypothetical protein